MLTLTGGLTGTGEYAAVAGCALFWVAVATVGAKPVVGAGDAAQAQAAQHTLERDQHHQQLVEHVSDGSPLPLSRSSQKRATAG